MLRVRGFGFRVEVLELRFGAEVSQKVRKLTSPISHENTYLSFQDTTEL